jgi:hypothetical protein
LLLVGIILALYIVLYVYAAIRLINVTKLEEQMLLEVQMYERVKAELQDGHLMVSIRATCEGSCGKTFELAVAAKEWHDWRSGALIQNAMPSLDSDQRELLISGLCGTCYSATTDEGIEKCLKSEP